MVISLLLRNPLNSFAGLCREVARLNPEITKDYQLMVDKELSLKDFQRIPGVGKSISSDLWDIGYRSVEELRDQDPQHMFEKLCAHQGQSVDRCVLYVFRCAVYFASEKSHEPEKLKWWNWKDTAH